MIKGLYVFEGLDGSGKTTLMNRVSEILDSEGFANIKTRQPGGCPETIALREKVCAETRLGLSAEREIYWEDYRIHQKKFIQPNLDNGLIVLCDRYYFYSTLVYQGYDLKDVPVKIEELLNKGVDLPEKVFLVNTPPEICQGRMNNRNEEMSGFDKDSMAEKERRYRTYCSFRDRAECVEIDWKLSVEEAAEKIVEIIRKGV